MKFINPFIQQIKTFFDFVTTLFKMREVLFQLARRDFIAKYIASYIGIYWAFIQPFISIFVMWFVFTFGFKPGKMEASVPFIAWLVCGMIPWFFFKRSYQRRHTLTRGLLISHHQDQFPQQHHSSHQAFNCACPAYHVSSSFSNIQHCIWLLSFMALAANSLLFVCKRTAHHGITWFTSRCYRFCARHGTDCASWHAANVLGNTYFLASFHAYGKTYLCCVFKSIFLHHHGYRDTFIYRTWFFEHPGLTIYFWSFTLFFFVFGALVFSRLKPHFADVL